MIQNIVEIKKGIIVINCKNKLVRLYGSLSKLLCLRKADIISYDKRYQSRY